MIEIISIIGVIVGVLSIKEKVKGSVLILLYWIFELAYVELEVHLGCDLWSYWLKYFVSWIPFILMIVWLIIINRHKQEEGE